MKLPLMDTQVQRMEQIERRNRRIRILIFMVLFSAGEALLTTQGWAEGGMNDWWIAEYPALVRTVEAATNGTLRTSYRTGQEGKAKVELTLIRKRNGGLTLRSNLPPQAIFSIDSKTGQRIPSSIRPVIIIRDHDTDGVSDDFKIEPAGESVFRETVTKDGFIKFRSGPDHQSIWLQWSFGIGFSVNHFLHGVDSALPRRR